MKQGQAHTSRVGATKQEPTSHGINPEYAAEIGLQKSHITTVPMYEGRGIEAPSVGTTSHHCGSQGKH